MPGGSSHESFAKGAVDWLLQLTGPKPRVVVAYSGGLDSTVLAHVLVNQRRRLGELRLAHVDHGLQSASGDWSDRCLRQSKSWRVPFIALKASIASKRGESLEALARDARYELLAGVLRPGEFLATAQHRDDQAETVLLQLFRGAGVPGLAGMPSHVSFACGTLVRPLLRYTRADLEQYAHDQGLRWIDDPTNEADRFDRNYLRRRVMPILRERWPGVVKALNRTSSHMLVASKLMNAQAIQDLAAAMDGEGLSVVALRRLPFLRRGNALRLFIARAGFEVPPTTKMHEITGPLLEARSDAQPEVRWRSFAIRRRSGRVTVHIVEAPIASPDSALKSWRWKEEREFILSGLGDRLELVDDATGSIDLDKLPARLRLKRREGGESLRPGARARSQSLKKLLQAAKISVEDRARLPLLFGEGPKGRLVAAGDRWIDASVAANVKSRRRARLVWTRGK
jgi:tRNA(Ile)-lysidine synthase